MKRPLILIAALFLLLPSLGLANTLTIRLGYFIPGFKDFDNTGNSLWSIEFDQMSFLKRDFQEGVLGVTYDYFVSRQLSLGISVDTYNKSKAGFYRDWVGYEFDEGTFAFPLEYDSQNAFSIAHNLNVSITPVIVSVKLTPLGRRNKVVPYLGAGAGIYFWTVSMRGEIVDFSDEWIYEDEEVGDVPIYGIAITNARESRINFGYQAFAGIMVPIAQRLTIDVGATYSAARGKFRNSEYGFEGFDDFDLGGITIAAGINYWF
ncbi:MAG: hypothetical protein OEW05_05280 [Candidatus Aminicenantes bacterium]|nr:hypothetical protein [Candidatus Aminicenantes bacterium]